MVVYEHELPNPNKYIGSQKTKMAPPVFFAFFSKLIFLSYMGCCPWCSMSMISLTKSEKVHCKRVHT